MSRKPKYELSTMNVGEKIKVDTTPETHKRDVHRLRSAISQYIRLNDKTGVSYEITVKEEKQILCKRLS